MAGEVVVRPVLCRMEGNLPARTGAGGRYVKGKVRGKEGASQQCRHRCFLSSWFLERIRYPERKGILAEERVHPPDPRTHTRNRLQIHGLQSSPVKRTQVEVNCDSSRSDQQSFVARDSRVQLKGSSVCLPIIMLTPLTLP